MPYTVELPDGTLVSDIPDDMPQDEVRRRILATFPQFAPKQSTLLSEVKRGAKQLLSSTQTGVGAVTSPEEAAKAGVERAQKIGEEAGEGVSFAPVKEAYQREGILSALGEAASQVPRAVAGMAPAAAAAMAGARVGALAGTAAAPALGPFAPFGPMVGGALGAGAALYPSIAGSFVERQAQGQMERGEPVQIDRLAAYGTAVPATALEAAGTGAVLGKRLVKGVLGIADDAALASAKAKEALVKEANRSLLGATGRGALRGATEMPVEVAQSVLERAQAGLDVLSPEAFAEYGESAYQGFIGGAGLGAITGVPERASARAELAKIEVPKERQEAQRRLLAAREGPKGYEGDQALLLPKARKDEFPAVELPTDLAAIEKEFTELQKAEQTPEAQARMAALARQYETVAAKQPETPKSIPPEQLGLGLEQARTYGDMELEKQRLLQGKQTPDVKARVKEITAQQAQMNITDIMQGRKATAQQEREAKRAAESAFSQPEVRETPEGQQLLFSQFEAPQARVEPAPSTELPTREQQPLAPSTMEKYGQRRLGLRPAKEGVTTSIAAPEVAEAPLPPVTEAVPEPKLAPKVPAEFQPVMEKLTAAGVRPETQAWAENARNRPFLRKLMDMAPEAAPQARKALKLQEGSPKAEVFDALFPQPGVPAFEPAVRADQPRMGLPSEPRVVEAAKPPSAGVTEPVGAGVVPAERAAPAAAKPEGGAKPALEPAPKVYPALPRAEQFWKDTAEAVGGETKPFTELTPAQRGAWREAVQEGDAGTLQSEYQRIVAEKPAAQPSRAAEVKEARRKAAEAEVQERRRAKEAGEDMLSLRGEAGAKQVSDFEQSLRTALNKFGLKDVGVKLIDGMREEGSYAQQLIRIASDAANPIRTLRHEAIHALRELGFFTEAQWQSLSKMAKDKWIDQYLKQRNIDGKPLKAGEESRYDAYMREYNGDMEKITEEAVADAFADFDATKPPAGMVAAVLDRMRKLFQGLKSALTKVESPEQIFGKVERGALKEESTANFLRWSRNAPLVKPEDALNYDFQTGKPFVAKSYHGTNAEEDFTKFDIERGGAMTGAESASMGVFSTSEPVVAGEYAKNVGMGRYLGLMLHGAKHLADDSEAKRLQGAVKDAEAAVNKAIDDVINSTKDKIRKRFAAIGEEIDDAQLDFMARALKGDTYRDPVLAKNLEDAYIAHDVAKQELSSYILDYEASQVPQRIMPLYVRMENPKVYDAEGKSPAEFALSDRIAQAKEEGHDGVVFKNIADPSPVAVHYVSFKETDIKSASGNIGTYSETDADIRKSLRAPSPTEGIAETSELMEELPTSAERTLKKAMRVFLEKDDVPFTTRFRTELADAYATVVNRLNVLYDGKVRDEFTKTANPELLMRQAQAAEQMFNAYLTVGGIEKDVLAGQYVITEPPKGVASHQEVLEAIKKWGDAKGMDFKLAYAEASKMLEAQRLNEMLKVNQAENKQVFTIHKLSQKDSRSAEEQVAAAMRGLAANPGVQEIGKMMDAQRAYMIDKMVETGRISKDTASQWKDASGYVPFDRIDKFFDKFSPKRTTGRGLAQLGSLPKLVGTNRLEVGNVFDNQAKLMTWMLKQTIKQDATYSTLRTLADIGQATDLKRNKHAATNPNNVVKTYKDGIEYYFEVKSHWDVEAFKDLQGPKSYFAKVFAGVSNILRKIVTVMPPFVAKQVTDDIQRAFVTSGVEEPYKLVLPAVTNFLRIAGHELVFGKSHPITVEFAKKGLVGDVDYNASNPAEVILFNLGYSQRGWLSSLHHRLESVTRASDLAIRKAIYDRTIEETKTKEMGEGDMGLATARAREFINFRRRGASQSVGSLIATVPFFNAYLQSTDLLLRSATGRGSASVDQATAKRLFWMQASKMLGFSLIYALVSSGDEKYEDLTLDGRADSWVINGKELPVPGDLAALFKVPVEALVHYMSRLGTPEEQLAKEAITQTLGYAFEQYGGRVTPIPQAVRPIIEAMFNRSTVTGRKLVGTYQEGMPGPLQTVSSTSELAKAIANFAYKNIRDPITGTPLELSPIVIDNMLRGYFGGAVPLLNMLVDQMLNPNKTDRPLSKYWFLSQYLTPEVPTGPKEEFYDLANKVMPVKRALDNLAKTDQEAAYAYYQENKDKLKMAELVNIGLQNLKQSRDYIKFLESAEGAKRFPDSADRLKRKQQVEKYENDNLKWVRKAKADIFLHSK